MYIVVSYNNMLVQYNHNLYILHNRKQLNKKSGKGAYQKTDKLF